MSNLTQSFPSSAPITEKREIITKTDLATGTVTYEEWRKDGKLDRADGPAYIKRDAATGTVTCEAWYNKEVGHRFEPSTELRAAWLKNSGERIAPSLASASPPAPIPQEERKVVTETDPETGIVICELWYNKDGQYDRADGPAVIVRNAATGTCIREAWLKDDERFEPTAEVRAAWLKKEERENAERIARVPASSAPATFAP